MPQLPESFRCFLVRKTGKDQIESSIEKRPLADLPAGEVLVRVAYSSLNYKDAMAATGHPGIVKNFPHVPGIDAAGTVVASDVKGILPDQQVIVTSYELGSGRWGAWAEYIRVPAEWVVPLPEGLRLEQAMVYGTAGFTAAQCVLAIQDHNITPDMGDIVVTGATGGVGGFAVEFLAKLGYRVTAVSGKPEQRDALLSLGASDVIDRNAVIDDSNRPLLKTRWAGGVDTVGGNTLATLLRSTKHGGCVAACGLVGGSDLPLTVYPFILRGVTLSGIDSAWCPQPRRRQIWNRLATDWKLDNLESRANTVTLEEVDSSVQSMLGGQHVGRTVVRLGA